MEDPELIKQAIKTNPLLSNNPEVEKYVVYLPCTNDREALLGFSCFAYIQSLHNFISYHLNISMYIYTYKCVEMNKMTFGIRLATLDFPVDQVAGQSGIQRSQENARYFQGGHGTNQECKHNIDFSMYVYHNIMDVIISHAGKQ